jgi:hypothetical protein
MRNVRVFLTITRFEVKLKSGMSLLRSQFLEQERVKFLIILQLVSLSIS